MQGSAHTADQEGDVKINLFELQNWGGKLLLLTSSQMPLLALF